ncbi:MAG: prolipoprotein diacylglyceryl transferase [Candidatus Pacebacteria bacterium]|nr:prolipoprotein diacylglyceryl transferase [Candidatus Paceibacterota bacterium]
MWPVIFSLGRFELRTISVFFFIALFSGSYVFWRRGKEEHYSEMDLFDGLILSLLFGSLLGRLAFIFFNLEQLGVNLIKWLDIFTYPGINLPVLFIAGGIYLYRFSLKKRWDVFEVLDFSVGAFSLSQFFIWTGSFLDGTGFGVKTDLPIGIVFPGVFEKHHPVQLYFMIFYLALFLYLVRVEYNYRTYSWYRFGKKTAQTGFLTSMFFIFFGFFNLIISFFSLPTIVVGGLRLDYLLSIFALLFGIFLLSIRSGRISTKFFGKRNKRLLETFKV